MKDRYQHLRHPLDVDSVVSIGARKCVVMDDNRFVAPGSFMKKTRTDGGEGLKPGEDSFSFSNESQPVDTRAC